MAIVPMQRIRIYGLQKNRKKILELVQRRGIIEFDEKTAEQEDFSCMDVSSSLALFEKSIRACEEALAVLQEAAPAKKPMLSMLAGRRELTLPEYEAFAARRGEVQKTVNRVNALVREIDEKRAGIRKLTAELEGLSPWLGLDVPMRFRGTKTAAAFVGVLPEKLTERALLEKLRASCPDTAVSAEIVSAAEEQTCVFLLCPRRKAQQVENALRSLGFASPPLPSKTVPAERGRSLSERRAALEKEQEALHRELVSLAEQRQDIEYFADYLTMRLEKYRLLGRLGQSKHVFVAQGYLPAPSAPALQRELEEGCGAAVELETPGEDEDVPVLLKNNRFTEPVEGVLESFSMPGRGEIDPTPVMAVFYYVLFGMMLSDAAYGILMVLACGFCLWRFKNMEPGMRKSLRMFFFCGISTTVWGFLYGSFFGDVVAVFSKTFLGAETALPPLWFAPVDDPMKMLLFSMLIGIIHLFTGLALCGYQLLRQKRWKDALYDVAFWYFLVGGLLLLLLSSDMFTDISQMQKLPAVFGTVGTAAAAVGAFGILMTGGRESRHPVKRLLKGAYALYNVTGYLGDILSYSRLLALGLATGVIAEVINSMASLAGGGVVGFIAFGVIFLAGHVINIGINLLGAYVHTNRLQFVEFFGKFFEGGGRRFSPFGVHTKYFKIREEK